MSSVFFDKKHRPVFNTHGGGTVVYVWNEDQSEYVYVDTYMDEDHARKHHPDMVRHVNRRSEPPKRRHPDVHYKPTRMCIECWLRPDGTLKSYERLNAKVTTNVAEVTCKACLRAIILVARNNMKGGVK